MIVVNKIIHSCKALFTLIAIVLGTIIVFTHNTDFANIATICFSCIPTYLALNVAQDFSKIKKEVDNELS